MFQLSLSIIIRKSVDYRHTFNLCYVIQSNCFVSYSCMKLCPCNLKTLGMNFNYVFIHRSGSSEAGQKDR